MKSLTALTALTALLLLLATVEADGDTTTTITALKKCAKDSGLSSQTLKKACDSELPAGSLESYKCFTKCVQLQVGIMSADGTINPENSASLVPEAERAKMLDIAKRCTGVATKDLCEKSYTVDKCYHQNNSEMYKRNCLALMATVEN